MTSTFYQQPAYTGQYSQPYSQYPPQPQPQPPFNHYYHVDPAAFRKDFANRLNELTVNSRPIIQSLSMFAHDYVRFAEIVSQCLQAHIRRVPPWMKLPAFYLLDMISKNIYEPYARHFAAFVIPLFLESYGQVDDSTRGKMEELLLTWRTGSPTGKEIFGVAAQVAIERGIWGDGAHQSVASGSGQITKAQVISELEFTLGQKERALQANPYDPTTQNHINILHQLRKLVESGVSQTELQQILAQLHTLMRNLAPPAAPQQPPIVAPQWSQTSYPPPPPSVHPQPSAVAAAPPPSSFTDLLSTLVKAGVVSATGTPVGAGATTKEEESKDIKSDLEHEASRMYRNTILSQPVQLSTSGITKTRPKISEFLYSRLPSQCKQCGIRFADSAVGKKQMEDHLDMHFRQNRKAIQNVGRGHCRSWFITVDDWVNNTDVKGKTRADGSRPLNSKAAAAAELAKRDAELRAQFVIVPPGDEAKPLACPICKEQLNSEFLEEDEEWVWKNAIKKDDRVYHATCHSEALHSTTTLAARLRNELGGGHSRSATPEVSRQTPPPSSFIKSLSPSPDSKVGLKRKAEDTSFSNSSELGTPPTKKLALQVP